MMYFWSRFLEHAGNAAKAVLALSADGQLVQMAKVRETIKFFGN